MRVKGIPSQLSGRNIRTLRTDHEYRSLRFSPQADHVKFNPMRIQDFLGCPQAKLLLCFGCVVFVVELWKMKKINFSESFYLHINFHKLTFRISWSAHHMCLLLSILRSRLDLDLSTVSTDTRMVTWDAAKGLDCWRHGDEAQSISSHLIWIEITILL